ncbi:MAG: type II toxin-antitoxin system YoeB family toxin [Prevotellaceae bacterium]|nr:type II toxin-antitoxin system YoeB family toxin [Prevotellaceae bacterium]
MRELKEHPKISTGHPKPLGDDKVGQWSRRITEKHRLIYEIQDEAFTVVVARVYGHYGDK